MRRALVLGFLGTALASSPLHADPALADKLAAEADQLGNTDHFVDAAKRYREAFAADPRPELICNVGVAYYKAKDLSRAHRYLEQCIAIGTSLETDFIGNLRQVLAAVETSLRAEHFALVEIAVEPATASIIIDAGDEPLVGSSHVWLSAGNYKLAVHAEGYVDKVVPVAVSSTTTVSVTVSVTVKLERPRIEAPAKATTKKTSSRPALIASIATAGVGLAAGASYLFALHRADQSGALNATLDDHDRLADSAHTYQHLSWGLGIAAAIGAGVSGYLWYSALKAPQLEVAPTAGGVALSLTGRW